MTWLRPVDRTSGTLTLSAGTLSCLAHHRTPLSKRCPTTTALERTTVPMDEAERMPPLGAVKPRQKLFDAIHRAQRQGRRTANESDELASLHIASWGLPRQTYRRIGIAVLKWISGCASQQKAVPLVRDGSGVRISPRHGRRPYRRIDPKAASTDWCISANCRHHSLSRSSSSAAYQRLLSSSSTPQTICRPRVPPHRTPIRSAAMPPCRVRRRHIC
jgi:hypothetical protein